jgi:acyl-CoA thioester hydrolase|tara:strand:- start:11 stop:430 length:420 start_codon:yes stop_codon:yes gene_type:complete
MDKNNNLSSYPIHVELQTRWRDLDAFGHVNNAVFATYIETARGTLFKRWNLPFNGMGQSLIVASITIDYHQQLKHPSDIIVGQKISRIGTSSFDIESSIFNRTNTSESIASAKVTVVCFDFDQQQSVPVFEQIINDFKG